MTDSSFHNLYAHAGYLNSKMELIKKKKTPDI